MSKDKTINPQGGTKLSTPLWGVSLYYLKI